ncbi:ABC transporter permease [Culicoidibacter larvae]|uniref:ABC transporter permease n=1 Tax=Culicoidibacter larvae TaxID=2579976 RepID=A0A5R8Q995_9FIRM|nr:ABC transporter permease [Culicoidibacter larvae]TLG72480.1 ABC transporter permease [Culicoidibacter larvae]
MLFKLSFSNIRKMLKDYLTLIVGLVMAVAIFYMFETLAMNDAFVKANAIIGAIMLVFQVGAFLLAIITFFYIFYANSFFLSFRTKEFGMYMMLGAKKSKVMQLVFFETLGMGVVALLIGTVVGALLSQGVATMFMGMLDIQLDGYQAFFFPSFTITAIFFLLLFFITSVVNASKIARKSVLELLTEEQKTQRPKKRGVLNFIGVVISIVLLVVGYYLIYNVKTLQIVGLFGGAFTITTATYLLFIIVVPTVIGWIQKTNFKSKGINAFTLAQLQFRAQSLTKVLGTVAMLIALGAGAMTAGMAFKENIMLQTNQTMYADVTLVAPSNAEHDLVKQLTDAQITIYHFKDKDGTLYFDNTELNNQKWYYTEYNFEQGSIEMKQVQGNLDYSVADVYEDESDTVYQWYRAIGDWNLRSMYRETKIAFLNTADFNEVDADVQTLEAIKVADFIQNKPVIEKINNEQTARFSDGSADFVLGSKYDLYVMMYAFASGTMFMGFFLGFAFLSMMASILMFKILASAKADKPRYDMLSKMGVRERLLKKSAAREILVLFAIPGIVGVLHVIFGMQMFSVFLQDPYYQIWLPLTIFTVVYAIYYVVTVWLYRSIVLPKRK